MVQRKQTVAEAGLSPLQRGDRRYVIGGCCRFSAMWLCGRLEQAAARFSDIGA